MNYLLAAHVSGVNADYALAAAIELAVGYLNGCLIEHSLSRNCVLNTFPEYVPDFVRLAVAGQDRIEGENYVMGIFENIFSSTLL